MSGLKSALADVDLASMSLDGVKGVDPQMARVLRSVQKWSTETVAHQNHSSHGDSSSGARTSGEKATLRHALE